MGQDPDLIRSDINRTRQEMDQTLDVIEEKVSPSRIVQRRTDRLRSAVAGARERVMGSTEELSSPLSGNGDVGQRASERAQAAGDRISGAARDVSDSVQQAPEVVRTRTQGNPLAAGLVAFGAGLLVGSLLPETKQEQQATQRVKERLEPVKQELAEAGKEVAEELKTEAQAKAEDAKQSVTQATETVKEEAQDASSTVQEEAQERAGQVRDST